MKWRAKRKENLLYTALDMSSNNTTKNPKLNDNMEPAPEDQLILPNNHNNNSNNINHPNKNIKKKGYCATCKHANKLK
jgi:hypothetical protein